MIQNTSQAEIFNKLIENVKPKITALQNVRTWVEEVKIDGWKIYDTVKEFERQGVLSTNFF